jgi:hypothetical protein
MTCPVGQYHAMVSHHWQANDRSWHLGAVPRPRAGQEEQSGGEFTSAGTAARTKDATLQIAKISAKFCVRPRRHLQHLLHPTPSHFLEHTTTAPRRGDGAMARCDRCRIIHDIRRLKARVGAVNVTTPSRESCGCTRTALAVRHSCHDASSWLFVACRIGQQDD